MSVIVTLRKPVMQKIISCESLDITRDNFDKLISEQEDIEINFDKCTIEDGTEHKYEDVTYLNAIASSNRGWKRYYKRLANLLKIQVYTDRFTGQNLRIAPVDTIYSFNSWGFKTRFFTRKGWQFILTNEKEIKSFIQRYVTLTDNETKEKWDELLKYFETGMYILVSW